jgi:hypothetical protein
MVRVSIGCVLCLACGDSERGTSSDWDHAHAVQQLRFDDPPPSEPHLRIVATLEQPNECSLFEKAEVGDPLALPYLAIYVRDVRPGLHVVVPPGSDEPTARVGLITAPGDRAGTSVAAQSGTVNLAFDRIDGPLKVVLDIEINRQLASQLTCIRGTDSAGEPLETCTCQRDDGSKFECTQRDSKESACCATADPQTAPLRAAFTATSCAAICRESGVFEVCKRSP